MSKRQYDGTPIDITWNSGPWANDGETVEATDAEDGNMITIEWPDNATDPEELNNDQIAVIRAAARNPDVENYAKIDDIAGVDKSESYSSTVLRIHWPERHNPKSRGKKSLSDRQVDKARIALNNGESKNWVADHFNVSEETVRRAAQGERYYEDVDCKTPELEVNNGEWSVKKPTTQEKTMNHKVSEPFPVATVDAWRKRALNGDTATDIADEYENIWSARVAMALRGDADIDGETTQPELEWNNSDRVWVEKESEGDVDADSTNPQDMTDTQEQPTEDATTTTDTEPPTYHPPERDNNRRLAYGVALVALVSYALGKLRGDGE